MKSLTLILNTSFGIYKFKCKIFNSNTVLDYTVRSKNLNY